MNVSPAVFHSFEPFRAFFGGGYPVYPSAPFDNFLVVVASNSSDVMQSHEVEGRQRMMMETLYDEVARMYQDIRVGIVVEFSEKATEAKECYVYLKTKR